MPSTGTAAQSRPLKAATGSPNGAVAIYPCSTEAMRLGCLFVCCTVEPCKMTLSSQGLGTAS